MKKFTDLIARTTPHDLASIGSSDGCLELGFANGTVLRDFGEDNPPFDAELDRILHSRNVLELVYGELLELRNAFDDTAPVRTKQWLGYALRLIDEVPE